MATLTRTGPSGFSASSTAEEVTKGIDGSGLTAVVTGLVLILVFFIIFPLFFFFFLYSVAFCGNLVSLLRSFHWEEL